MAVLNHKNSCKGRSRDVNWKLLEAVEMKAKGSEKTTGW